MSQNKTQATDDSVVAFLNKIENSTKKADAFTIFELMNEISKEPAKMWGASIIGYDVYHYKYESGREGDFFKIGFSPRSKAISFYIINGFIKNQDLLSQLGKYKVGKACLYVNKLSDIDLTILRQLIQDSYDYMTAKYG